MQEFLQTLKDIWLKVYQTFETPLFPIGEGHLSLGDIVYFLVSVVFLIYISGLARRILERSLLKRFSDDPGVAHSAGTIFRYLIIIVGFIVILQTAGLNLSSIGLIAGALGVGIGFGLQNVTNNFISGIIILFERPIKIGDRIQVGDIDGDVVRISARASTIITNDNIAVIVPNSEFINSQVINWSHTDRNVRFWFPVGVSYKEDPAKIREVLVKVAQEHPGVLQDPPPEVVFDEYGESSLNFHLVIWTSDFIVRPKMLRSQLYFSIFEEFKKQGIEIPFPQRDLHIKSDLTKN